MWYVIVGEDVQDSLGNRLATRPAHVQRLEALKTQGRLLLAGPFPSIDAPDPGPAGYTGSLIVAEFDTLDAAQQWANEEPYLAGGVYARVTVRPFRKTLPCAATTACRTCAPCSSAVSLLFRSILSTTVTSTSALPARVAARAITACISSPHGSWVSRCWSAIAWYTMRCGTCSTRTSMP